MSCGSSGSMPSRCRWGKLTAASAACRSPCAGARQPVPTGTSPSAAPPPSAAASRAALVRLAPREHHLVSPVFLAHQHLHRLVAGGGEHAADVVGPDRQLAVATVDEHGQLDASRPAEVDQLVERRPYGASREEHVVDHDHRAAVDGEHDVGALRDRLRGEAREIVTVERDVQRAHRRFVSGGLADELRQPARERHATAADAHQREPPGVRMALDDLVRDPGESAGHAARVHQDGACQGAAMLPRARAPDKRAFTATRQGNPRNDGDHRPIAIDWTPWAEAAERRYRWSACSAS